MSLRHIPIPSLPWAHPPRLPTYGLATRLQTTLQKDLLSWKEAGGAASSAPPPAPALITFTPAPTYTMGRRQERMSKQEHDRLRTKLRVETYTESSKLSYWFPKVEIVYAPRGGLTTYHGPGQLLFWPVIDLRSPLHAHFTVRGYVDLLEQTTVAALRQAYDLECSTTAADPGVWAQKARTVMGPDGEDMEVVGEEEKIASLGVHLRRHVTGLGIAVNFRMSVEGTDFNNPWSRIDPCGVRDARITTVNQMIRGSVHLEDAVTTLAPTWAAEFARRLGVANAADPAAGPLVETDDWNRWMVELQLRHPSSAGFVLATKRSHG
ncbi:hypothetical protein F4781DRAFT_420118 [Annulohypoxylon bovei var. microspora]|nr:hypothetical protein F4781DRAFT_420118 [Annulohypoxylon bovei var. microspora]